MHERAAGMISTESTIRRDAEGRWFHDGVEIDHEAISRAFDRWIDRGPDGRYILKNPISWAYVAIEGAPIFVRRVDLEPGQVLLHLSDDRSEPLAARTLRQGDDGSLYCDVRAGAMPARFTRGAQASLAPLVGEDEGGVYLEVAGLKVRPPIAPDPLNSSPPTD